LENELSLLVGLTGGMGSGKTLAASFFKDLGAFILDADLICRKLVEPGQPALKEIEDTFGKEIFSTSGNLDRRRLADLVFDDPEKKQSLENILHPRVFEFERLEYEAIQMEHPNAIVIVDAALLIESGNYKKMDKVIVLNSDEKNRINRILARSELSKDEITARIKNQMPSEEKVRYADFVLENSSDKDNLRSKVKDIHAKLALLATENIEKSAP
jgi:dephospho-CoA kinase